MNNIKIEHLVLSGGAYLGYYHIGALQFLEKHNFIKRENLKSIYGTSIGSLVGVLLCLKLDWDIIDDYIIKRPWEKLFELDLDKLMDIFKIKGLFNKSLFNKIFEPLFLSCNLKKDITLKELYEYSNIELYIFAVDIISLKLKNFSYKTHPDLEVINAVYMSCSLPFIFEPYEYEYLDISNNKKILVCVDGGLFNSYPIQNCIKDQNIVSEKLNTILGITFNRLNFVKNENINEEIKDIEKYNNIKNIFEFGYFLFKQISYKLNYIQEKITYYKNNEKIKKNFNEEKERNNKYFIYELMIPCKKVHLEEGLNVILDEKTRSKYIKDGEKYAYVFYNSILHN